MEEQRFTDLGLGDLRRELLNRAAGVAFAVAAGLVLFTGDTYDVRTFLPPMLLLGGASLCLLAARWFRSIAALIFAGGLLATGMAGVEIYPPTTIGGGFAIMVIVAGVMLGEWYAVTIAAALTALIVIPFNGYLLQNNQFHHVDFLLIPWTSAGVTWLITRPFHTLIAWSWHAYAEAGQTAHELRLRQGQLNQALKGLDEAYYRLERSNEELARARQAAEEARRLKAEFAATISHELRTPLNLIVGLSEMILLGSAGTRGPLLPTDNREDLEIIYRNAAQIANLIDDVLDLSQVDAHRMALEKQDLELADLITEVVAMVNSLFSRKGLSLSLDLDPELPKLNADPNRIRQILINLLANAARFTNEGGVTIGAQHNDREITISVADTGTGISAQDLPRVFQEFRQVGNAISHRYGGSGFGLYISKRFVELHGGTMWVESVEGQGTTFFFNLPLRGAVVSDPVPISWDRLTRTALSRVPTVAVHGSAQAIRFFQRYLDEYRVLAISNSTSLDDLEWQRHPPQALIITGPIDIPKRSLRLPANDTNLPVVTCHLHETHQAEDDLGIAAYLVKPITRGRLAASLQGLGRGVHRILIVEDDLDLARLIARMISGLGGHYQVATVNDGSEALRQMRAAPPDVILLDLLLPTTDGLAVLKEMHTDSQLCSISVIVISAAGQDDDGPFANTVSIGRGDGLAAGEAMRLIKAGLDILLPRPAQSS